ncbi:MAG: response regulator [Trichodesmium sp. St2_bin6]|nr:response regulator [Trichodesmium sp. St5_bin8]MDE5077078.1 response regulator [Trichodesmium sp. St2_bin6]MDE5102390.1 response regulator [Trichodesmium sp. St19_bin2]
MTSYENSNNKLFDVFLNDIPDKFTGKLEVKSSRQSWTIFLCIGHLAWAIGGKHYNRRFYKIWHQFCSNVPLEKIKLRKQDTLFCNYYYTMSVLSRRKVLTIPQIKAVVSENLEEVLFDILQEESQEKLTYDISNSGFDKTSTIISSIVRLETVISRVNKLWENWQNSNLAAYSPNLIPTIINYEKLQKIAKNNTYKTITKLVDGKKSLRETAAVFKKDVRELTLFLIPYVKNKLVNFKEGADKKNLERSTQDVHKQTTPKQSQALIVCVDDSKETCYILEKIIEKTGYKFMGIQDSIKALFMIIESKPDLIFLDLMMPIANGYEICTQLRRVSIFENTPIIILTGSDGVVDRVRAKMVGATGYLTKPIEPKKVLALVKNYLQNPRSPDTQIKSDESDL